MYLAVNYTAIAFNSFFVVLVYSIYYQIYFEIGGYDDSEY